MKKTLLFLLLALPLTSCNQKYLNFNEANDWCNEHYTLTAPNKKAYKKIVVWDYSTTKGDDNISFVFKKLSDETGEDITELKGKREINYETGKSIACLKKGFLQNWYWDEERWDHKTTTKFKIENNKKLHVYRTTDYYNVNAGTYYTGTLKTEAIHDEEGYLYYHSSNYNVITLSGRISGTSHYECQDIR